MRKVLNLGRKLYSPMEQSIRVNCELALMRDMDSVFKCGQTELSMKVTGETMLHLGEANSSTLMATSMMVSNEYYRYIR
jgi:hypothetical protein